MMPGTAVLRLRTADCCLIFSVSNGTFDRLQGNILHVREVLDEFLSKYPLCYGYWQQYATAEAQHGDRAKEVYEQGVAATPYSIDLWIYYLEWLRKQEDTTPEAVRTCVSLIHDW
jgi:hypothetical protein